MAIFQCLLRFPRNVLARLRDKRKSRRYPVGAGFPLKATLTLVGADPRGKRVLEAAREWAGPLANFSNGGICVLLPPSALTVRGEETTVHLSLEEHRLSIPCRVAFLRVYTAHAACGLQLEFRDEATHNAYLQLFEAVVIGATLAPVSRGKSARPSGGLIREQYKSDNGTQLTVWRKAEARALDCFEFAVGNHCLRGESDSKHLTVFNRRAKPATAQADPAAHDTLLHESAIELRRLFRYIVPNLTKAVPNDVRQFLAGFMDKVPAAVPGTSSQGWRKPESASVAPSSDTARLRLPSRSPASDGKR